MTTVSAAIRRSEGAPVTHTSSAGDAPSAVTHCMAATQVPCAGLEHGESSEETGSGDLLTPPATSPATIVVADIPTMPDIDAMVAAVVTAFPPMGPMVRVVHTAPLTTMAR